MKLKPLILLEKTILQRQETWYVIFTLAASLLFLAGMWVGHSVCTTASDKQIQQLEFTSGEYKGISYGTDR